MAKEDKNERPLRGNVELYRSYGVKRRLRPWKEKIELGFYKIFVFWVLCVLGLAALLAIVNFFLYYPEVWLKLFLLILFAFLFGFRMTRTVRKRLKFHRQLKKRCKEHRYILSFEQNFFQSLFWSGNRQDFILETEDSVYIARYLTVKKYRSTLYLEEENLLRLVKRPLNSRFTEIFDFRPRAKYYPMETWLGTDPCGSEKRIVKVLLVNPVCEEIFYKKKDGGYETTGNGGKHFGYTVFTASGFLEELRRKIG